MFENLSYNFLVPGMNRHTLKNKVCIVHKNVLRDTKTASWDTLCVQNKNEQWSYHSTFSGTLKK